MDYISKKGITLKNGKHIGVGETISENDYNVLTEEQKSNFEQKQTSGQQPPLTGQPQNVKTPQTPGDDVNK
jgi:hypothetical protein